MARVESAPAACSTLVDDASCPRHVVGCGTPPAPGRPALFLDRDGVVNLDHGYTHRREDFSFVPGVFDLGRRATAAGMALMVVTNQAGIGRGLYHEAAFIELSAWMVARFADEGVAVARVYYCPHHPEATIERYRLACSCRKPAPGMILAARQELQIDLARSILIGDKASDLQAGASAGVGTLVLFGDQAPPPGVLAHYRSTDLAALAGLLF